MTEFTASNGYTILARENATVDWWSSDHVHAGIIQVFTHSQVWDALREFFRHERDKELGRWRWRENPDYVVYPPDQYGYVMALNETEGFSGRWTREASTDPLLKQDGAAARAYFEAHPEPKSWGVRSPGEVWDIDVDTGGVRAVTVYSSRHDEPIIVFRDAFTQVEYEEDDPSIRDARKVWGPEEAS